ncbi:MAG: lycopene cyclase family protein, partial [Mycobacterium sp.]
MDVQAKLSQLNPAARAALAQKIKTHLSVTDTASSDHDVVIAGGGVAALTLALEMRRARPHTRILIVDPRTHPVPEITHTVGESTVEIAAHYLRDRLALADHLHTSQLRKMGLRMFFSHDGNTDITQRMELGSSSFIPQVTYQIDRGRLENELHRRCLADGVEISTGRVLSVDFGSGNRLHKLAVQRDETTAQITARWVVDASGRNRTLPRQLELKRTNEHHCNAVWLRVATEIDLGRWSDDPDWQARLVEGDRAMSTNHLMGQGYWVWLIRLPSGSTSVGIVADPAFHAFGGFNTLAKAQSWLAEHEPQCAAVLAEH